MRDEALIHFHRGAKISAGVHLQVNGLDGAALIEAAAPYLDADHPNRSVVGFCAVHSHLIEDLYPAPPAGWMGWRSLDWDQWFGRINGTYLVDLENRRVVQFPMYRSYGTEVPCDLSAMPAKVVPIESWLNGNGEAEKPQTSRDERRGSIAHIGALLSDG